MTLDVKKYTDDIARGISELVQIKSVEAPTQPGMPFGPGAAKVLDAALAMGESLGFTTCNVDHYAGHIEYGTGEEIIGVLCHLDVVPEGEGWIDPPYSGIIRDGYVYGRGASDNKGPAVASLYAIKALADAGITNPKKRIRLILGCNEESGMACMHYYFEKQALPAFGFSPDAGYPICNREKGIIRFDFLDDGEAGLEITAGNAYNSVPDRCVANLPAEVYEKLAKAAKQYTDTKVEVEQTGTGVTVTVYGVSAHAARPEAGCNAALHMMRFFKRAGYVLPSRSENFANLIRDYFKLETNGVAMGVATRDEPSGELTLNHGMLRIGSEGLRATVDIRYPVTADGKAIIAQLEKVAATCGVCGVLVDHSEPLYLPEDHPAIQKLAKAYEKVTGKPGTTYSMGGGTYARTLKGNGVAFGPGLPDVNHNTPGGHQANEVVWIEDMVQHAEICAATLVELLADD